MPEQQIPMRYSYGGKEVVVLGCFLEWHNALPVRVQQFARVSLLFQILKLMMLVFVKVPNLMSFLSILK